MNRASRKARLIVMAAATVMVAGCAGTPLRVTCAPFRTHLAMPVPESNLINIIRDDVQPGMAAFDTSEIDRLAAQIDANPSLKAELEAQATYLLKNKVAGITSAGSSPVFLLLSGGGQWGAYGASFLEALNSRDSNAADKPALYPQATHITGVSTGALQALFVGAHANQPTKQWLTELRRQYSPASEGEIVDRGSTFGAVFTGSIAKLAPLRARIEKALCDSDADAHGTGPLRDQGDCPLIEALESRDGSPAVYLGFVDANSGQLQYVNVGVIAKGRLIDPATNAVQIMPMRERQQCLTAAAIASAAVPVQYQQLRITSDDPKTGMSGERAYMDGGVRQSVFAILAQKLLRATMRSMGMQEPIPGEERVFVLRNGPTVAPVDGDPDTSADALTAAMRGYQLMVNQSEVSSIAALRLEWANAPMKLTTADGYNRDFVDPDATVEGANAIKSWPNGCIKTVVDATGKESKEAMMFNPYFMSCLRAFGRFKARLVEPRTGEPDPLGRDGWIDLPPLVKAK
jgi:predicted acylesterase/phospholipase RssA